MIALGIGLLAASGLVQGHTFCVASSADLQAALDQSSDGGLYNGEDNTIMVVQNAGSATYSTGAATRGGPFHYINSTVTGALILGGGYNSNCTVRTLKAALTILDGDHLTPVLRITSAAADINVTGLTIQNGESTLPGAGLAVNPDNAETSQVLIEENIIKNNHTTSSGGGLVAYSGGANTVLMFVEKNLIVGNSADQNDGAGIMVSNGAGIHLFNNTIIENTALNSGTTGGIKCLSGSSAHIWNNIFWNNTNYGLFLQALTAFVAYNDYDIWFGPTPQNSLYNISLNPLFVDAIDGDFHLRGISPAIAAAGYTTGSPDVEGNPTPLGGKMDMGAYEETIFIDNFDGG
jgi:parallel beta-helix repeat protein